MKKSPEMKKNKKSKKKHSQRGGESIGRKIGRFFGRLGIWLLTTLLICLAGAYVFFYYSNYEGSEYDTNRVSYLNVIKALFIIGLCLKYKAIMYKDKYLKFYFNLNVFALVLYLGVYWLPEISRIGFYMNMTIMFLIPRLLIQIPNNAERSNLTLFTIVSSFVLFVLLLLQFSSVNTRILPYQTWLFNGRFNYY